MADILGPVTTAQKGDHINRLLVEIAAIFVSSPDDHEIINFVDVYWQPIAAQISSLSIPGAGGLSITTGVGGGHGDEAAELAQLVEDADTAEDEAEEQIEEQEEPPRRRRR